MDKARQSIRSLMDIAPNRATIRRGDEVVEIDVEDVQIDDIMVIKPGQKIAMDGEVISGQSSVNQSAITGGKGDRRSENVLHWQSCFI